MKLITYTDTRTFDDFQHRKWIDIQREIKHGNYQKTAPYTNEENAIIDKAPSRHCFAIERPQDCKKSDAELFTEALFWNYWMVETANIKLPYDRPEIETELAETFTVESFCEYHGVTKNDFEAIKLAALFRSQPHHRQAWQVDKFRDEVLKQVELYLRSKKSDFSVMEWATIFYYAYEIKAIPKKRTKKEAIEGFIEEKKIDTTFKNFKVSLSEVNTRLNTSCDYPIEKLKKITPYMKEHFPLTIHQINDHIYFLLEEKRVKQDENEDDR